jgi:hypothetical protein
MARETRKFLSMVKATDGKPGSKLGRRKAWKK